MLIHTDMDLAELASLMGTPVTRQEAAKMRGLLCEVCTGMDTEDIDLPDWIDFISEAVNA